MLHTPLTPTLLFQGLNRKKNEENSNAEIINNGCNVKYTVREKHIAFKNSQLAEEYGERYETPYINYILSEDILDTLGVIIYFKGLKVIEYCHFTDGSPDALYLNGEYIVESIWGDGEMNIVLLRYGEFFIEI